MKAPPVLLCAVLVSADREVCYYVLIAPPVIGYYVLIAPLVLVSADRGRLLIAAAGLVSAENRSEVGNYLYIDNAIQSKLFLQNKTQGAATHH